MRKRRIYIAAALSLMLLLTGCNNSEIQEKKDAYRKIGINCMQEGDYEGAIEAFQNALDQSLAVVGEEEIDTCYYKAAAQYAAGKTEDAIATYQALIEYDEDNTDAYYLLGNLYLAEENAEEAKKNYDEATDRAGDDYQVYLAVYRQCTAAGLNTEAQDYLRKALDQGGKTAEDYTERGHIYLLLGDYDKAQDELETAMEKKSATAPLYMGQLYEIRGEDEKAAQLYESYVENNQEDPVALNSLGSMEMEKENYAKAIEYFSMALELEKPANEQTLRRNLILAYERSGDFTAAKEAMASYVEDYPMDEAAARENLFLMTR